MVRAASMPEEKRQHLVSAFASLKQRVLWKWENETLPNQPKNVKTSKWLPQRDILCHPNVKVFLSHGGLLGSSEAVHCGVTGVFTPMFGDQVFRVRERIQFSPDNYIIILVPQCGVFGQPQNCCHRPLRRYHKGNHSGGHSHRVAARVPRQRQKGCIFIQQSNSNSSGNGHLVGGACGPDRWCSTDPIVCCVYERICLSLFGCYWHSDWDCGGHRGQLVVGPAEVHWTKCPAS